ncbi:hypothetical protein SLA2020_279200 [Shorea laevis]
MASITMAAASFLSSTTLSNRSPVAGSRRIVVTNAARAAEGESRCCLLRCRDGSAEGPKPGSPEARKIYAPVCVTMPTAKICRK